MKFIKESKEIFWNYEAEFTEMEYNNLRNYAYKNCSLEEQGQLMVNWAIIDILRKQIKRINMKPNKNSKKVKKVLRKEKNGK